MAAESQAAAGEAQAESKGRGKSRRIVGVVTSNKMQKTVVVQVSRRVKDPKFHKYTTTRIRYKAHDEKSEYKVGDRVEIVETRPLSKDKRWRVARLIERPQEV
jgi:small subunit ribosomal protein S17